MKLPPMPRLGLAAWRNRAVVHAVFLALALATLALAVTLLREEKERAYQRYVQGFEQSLSTLAARLRHPTGQLALLNPEAEQGPLLLPFSTIDFDDPAKTRSAVEMSGCARQYASGASLCLAVGSNPYAGGFVYAVGSVDAPPLVSRERGQLELGEVHRLRVTLKWRGVEQHWIAPFEAMDAGSWQQRGRLTGFAQTGDELVKRSHPDRDFRGWIWREGPCVYTGADEATCPRRSFFSLRLPVGALTEALMQRRVQAWPPADLGQLSVHLELLGPNNTEVFDSAAASRAPLELRSLEADLQAGEVLTIQRDGKPIAELHGKAQPDDLPSPWLTRLIRRLPLNQAEPTLLSTESVATPLGRYELQLKGDVKSVDRALSAGASRVSWLVGGMLLAILLAWLVIALGLMRRIARLTRRAAAVSYNMQPARIDERIGELEVDDLRGSDELGILAGTLADLLARAKLALRREQLRAEQERDMWHAVGHEIMSPLQSLLALHGEGDTSRRYLLRMQQAVRVLYGTASPSEALAGAQIEGQRMDLAAFAAQLAANAAYAGIEDVQLLPWTGDPLWVSADEYSLEDVLTHVLRNAQRHHKPGTPILLTLNIDGNSAVLSVYNEGPHIATERLETIFEYGESDAPTHNGERRGQGLFVARSYLAKMDGRIEARNEPAGVRFIITLPLAP